MAQRFRKKSPGGESHPHRKAPALRTKPTIVKLRGRKSCRRLPTQFTTLSVIPMRMSVTRVMNTLKRRRPPAPSAAVTQRRTQRWVCLSYSRWRLAASAGMLFARNTFGWPWSQLRYPERGIGPDFEVSGAEGGVCATSSSSGSTTCVNINPPLCSIFSSSGLGSRYSAKLSRACARIVAPSWTSAPQRPARLPVAHHAAHARRRCRPEASTVRDSCASWLFVGTPVSSSAALRITIKESMFAA